MFNKKTQSVFERFPILSKIPQDKFPHHVFIIPDGNGRWAQKRSNIVLKGHEKGAKVIREILRDLSQLQEVKIVTVWGFSSDNWKRSAQEVEGLMKLFKKSIQETLVDIQERNGRFIHLGRKDRIPKDLLETLNNVEKETASNSGQIVCMAIDFGGEDEEIRVIEKARKLDPEVTITPEVLWKLRDGGGLIQSADLLIRSAGERRTSDVGWLNGRPTEIFILEKFFPDVTIDDIVNAVVDFSTRERRFGGRKSSFFQRK